LVGDKRRNIALKILAPKFFKDSVGCNVQRPIDGSLDTLVQVIDFYAAGGNANPWLDSKIRMVHLTTREKADLVAFLKSLSGEVPSEALPDTILSKR
jgi:hypothetical protein